MLNRNTHAPALRRTLRPDRPKVTVRMVSKTFQSFSWWVGLLDQTEFMVRHQRMSNTIKATLIYKSCG